MDLICQNTIINKIRKIFMLPLFLIILVTVTGCGNGTAEEDVKRVCESGENVESEKAESKTADGTSLITMAQLINEIDEGSGNNHIVSDSDKYPLPDTVLWFNATYAPLTYSNGGDWRIVGGLELSDENETLTRETLIN